MNDSDVPARGDFEHLLFARGYLISAKPLPAPASHWQSAEVGRWHLTWDPRLEVSFVERDERSILVIGNVIDLRREVTGAPVAAVLLDAWEQSRQRLDDSLEWLAGRYVVLGQSREGGFFQTDATGLLSASYASKHQVISSHQNLISEALGGLPGVPLGDPLPGLATKFAGVRMLTANTELNLGDFSVRRVGPAPLEDQMDPRDAAAAVLELIRRQYQFLGRDGGGPLISLTAGLDSRVTLAAMREMAPETLYFTYEKRFNGVADDSEVDITVARQLADRFGLAHHGFTLHTMDLDPELIGTFRRNTSLTHNRAIAAAYLRELPADRLHVRSNLYEIARGYYRHRDRPAADAQLFARLLTAKPEPAQRLVEEFEEMIAVTGILDVPGYDPLDLFYWEHRMTSWFHKVLLESDVAHDTHVLVNSRIILRLMLSVSDAERLNASVFDHLVDLTWPEVYELPVNGAMRGLPARR